MFSKSAGVSQITYPTFNNVLGYLLIGFVCVCRSKSHIMQATCDFPVMTLPKGYWDFKLGDLRGQGEELRTGTRKQVNKGEMFGVDQGGWVVSLGMQCSWNLKTPLNS